MNRTIKDATVTRDHDDDRAQPPRKHLADFLAACNLARRLQIFSELTPDEYIRKIWTSVPDRFIPDPGNRIPGLNTWFRPCTA